MAYSNNPNLVNARKETLLAVIYRGIPICTASRRFGVHRSTIWRWIKKWQDINRNVQLKNINHPSVPVGSVFRWSRVSWSIPTLSSAPKTHPARIARWIVERIVVLRKLLGRCAVIIHQKLVQEGITVSVSTVGRVIAKHCSLKTKRRKIRMTLPRPEVYAPGDLVEMDTVHYVNKLTGERRYVFTVIDLYSRFAYAKCFDHLLPGGALSTLQEAQKYFGFEIKTVQTDNGPEFSKWFTGRVETELPSGNRRVHRHTRIHSPNDNAHIERFNRTLRDECIGEHMYCRMSLDTINWELLSYLDYYNEDRLHLGLQCKTPRSMLQR